MKEKSTTGGSKKKGENVDKIVKSSSGRDTSIYSVKALNSYKKALEEKERMNRTSKRK